MNKKYIKIGAITLVSLGAIYGGYKLVKYLIGKSQEQKNQEIPVEIVDTSNKEEIKVVAKPTFDGAKIISKGSKGEEAKAVQQAINNIINDASKAITPTINKNVVPQYNWGSSSISSYTTSLQKPYLVSQIDATKEARRKKVASLKPLIADGDFGAKSVSTLIVIMGKSSASYNEVRDKRIAFSKVYGLGNPYKK
jgi:hypothetical protein